MDKKIYDEITQSYLDDVRRRKISDYNGIDNAKKLKHQNDINQVKKPLTAKEFADMFPSLMNMLTRKHVDLSAEEQHKIAKENTEKAHTISIADYNKPIEKFYKDLGINTGKEYVVDGDKLGIYYIDALNFADFTLDDLFALADNRKQHGKDTEVPGNLVWQATLNEKAKQLNKGNNAGI